MTPGTVARTGTVTFKDGSTTLGTAPFVLQASSGSPGQATLTVSSLEAAAVRV